MTKSKNLLVLGFNESLNDLIRKINYNFNIVRNNTSNSSPEVRQEFGSIMDDLSKLSTSMISVNLRIEALNERIDGILDSFETYDGDYEVTPTWSDQMLNTENKLMNSDVTINSIQEHRVSNDSGGFTFSI